MDAELLIDTIRTMTVILGGLLAGYGLRKSGRASVTLSGPINRVVLTYVQPLVMCLALWTMDRPDWRTLALPLFALNMILLMWAIATLLSPRLGLDRVSRGSFVTCSMFPNAGFTYGTFLAYVALGPQGAALGALYCTLVMPTLLTLGFYVARKYSGGQQRSGWRTLQDLLRHGHTRNPILGVISGLALNPLGPSAPAVAPAVIDVAMPAVTAALLVAVGLGLRLSAVRDYWSQCLFIHAVRFGISPAVGLALAFVYGYWQMPDSSLLTVAFIQSCTPTAILAVTLADLFDLNRKLSGALWLTTNLTAVPLAPVVLLISRAL